MYGRTGKSVKSHVQKVSQNFTGVVSSQSNVEQCVLCTGKHRVLECVKFREMRLWERLQAAKAHKVCFNCLLAGHIVRECKKPASCSVSDCARKHSTFLHWNSAGKPSQVTSGVSGVSAQSETGVNSANGAGDGGASGGVGVVVGNTCAASAGDHSVHMPIVPVMVNDRRVLALLDSGSTNSLISQSLATELELRGCEQEYIMNTVSHTDLLVSRVVEVNISSADGKYHECLNNVLVVKSIPATYPRSTIDVTRFPHLAGIQFPDIEGGTCVDLIIGMDNSHMMIPHEIRRDPSDRNAPFASLYVLGWCLNGPIPGSSGSRMSVHFTQLERKVENLWRIENDDVDSYAHSVEDRKVLELWDRKIYRDSEGHYVLPIPWKDGTPNLPNNKFVAQTRLASLCKGLNRKGMTDTYDANIRQMITNGYAESVPEAELLKEDGTVWYLPHHPVVNDSKPGKVRPVFDCAAKLYDVSLNNQCYQGPNLVNPLVGVLSRFRLYPYAIMGDIEAMYLQVRVPECDRNALRFLWFDGETAWEYRMTSHLFGGVWCACSSAYALRRIVVDVNPGPSVEHIILKSFYVDDLLQSFPTTDEAIEAMRSTKEALKHGGFNLTKFTANHDDILTHIDASDRAKEVKGLVPDTISKALGVKWDVFNDCFRYVNKVVTTDAPPTRRSILSHVSSMYDPLGLIIPIVIRGRLLFQEATRLRLGWDDPVPPSLKSKWTSWLSSLNVLDELCFPRCVLTSGFEDCSIEFHHFCDTSSVGYGACSFVRTVNADGEIHVSLLAAKGRVAPLKPVTIPRLELASAVVAIKLDQMLTHELGIPMAQSFFWTDSQIVLAYITNEIRRFKVFVANRVQTIRMHSSPGQWSHIQGCLNPADVISRGCDVKDLPTSWTQGPEFLWRYKSEWSRSVPAGTDMLESDPEVSASDQCGVSSVMIVSVDETAHPMATLIRHYSSFYKMKKAISWIRRFVFFLQNKRVIRGPVSCEEMRTSEQVIIRHVQRQAFPDEVHMLQVKNQVKKSSTLYKLSPRLNDDGIMVVGGRLNHAPVALSTKCPVILPYGHAVSHMLIQDYQNRFHLGTEWLLSQIRIKYWIVKARSMIKCIKRKCVTCKRLYAAASVQKMADLPPERVHPGISAFNVVGVDIFGPFMVKFGRSQVKRYGCVYSCAVSRAVHIEKLDSLNTDSFINGFVRFVSRRGHPKTVMSDNGTNLVGTYNELQRSFAELDRHHIIQAARRRDIEWQFNPPMASHMGGIWERMIRTIRRILFAILSPNLRLSDEVLATVFCEAENIINSRPITKVSDDMHDDDPLTPNHLLMLNRNYSFPWAATHKTDAYRRQWRHAQFIVGHFWKRWVKEYLIELHRRQKWLEKKPNLGVGDVVLIMDENVPRGAWPLGRVVDVNVGRDGLVRSVRLRTKTTYLVRPITKLVVLESCSEG